MNSLDSLPLSTPVTWVTIYSKSVLSSTHRCRGDNILGVLIASLSDYPSGSEGTKPLFFLLLQLVHGHMLEQGHLDSPTFLYFRVVGKGSIASMRVSRPLSQARESRGLGGSD